MPKQEKYNLQRLLEMRERERENAVKNLAQRRYELASAEKELAARKKSVKDCRQAQQLAQTAMLEKAQNGVKTKEIVIHRQHLIDLREKETGLLAAVEQQKAVVARAEQELEKALLALGEATKEMKVIEKHRENWRREKKVEFTRQEQKTNDEIGAILHERQKFE